MLTYTEALQELLDLYSVTEDPSVVLTSMYSNIGRYYPNKYPIKLRLLIQSLTI